MSRVSSSHQKFTGCLCSRIAIVSDGTTAITQRESGQLRRLFHLFFAGICKLMEDCPKVTPPPRPPRARRNDGGQSLCRQSTGSVACQQEVDCQRRKQGLCVYPSLLISVTPNPDRNRWSLPLQLCVRMPARLRFCSCPRSSKIWVKSGSTGRTRRGSVEQCRR